MPPKQRPTGSRTSTKGGGAPSLAGLDRRLVALAAAGLAVVVAVVLGITLAGGGDEAAAGGEGGARAALAAAGCELRVVPGLAGDHSVTDPDGRSAAWNTDPPTSGPHFVETLLYGSYVEPVQQARALHNLEHGAITIQYGAAVPQSTVAELQAFYDAHRNGTILAPYPKLGKRIALSAWNADDPSDRGRGLQATCTAFDAEAYGAFFSAFQFRGPERFAPGAMAPGSA